jgi:hypothetical protein
MVKHLGLNPKGVLNKKSGVYDESKNTIETPKRMHNFASLKDMPKHALKPGKMISFD